MSPSPLGCFNPREVRTLVEAYEIARQESPKSCEEIASTIMSAAVRGVMTVDELVGVVRNRPGNVVKFQLARARLNREATSL